jgi:hypothetical protein
MIVLQFAQGNDLFARDIEWYGGGPKYSHVDSVLPDGKLIGARMDGGVQIRPADYLGDEKVLKVELPAGPSMTDAYYDFILDQVGKPYDRAGILGFLFGRNWRDENSWFCSELVATGLEQCGYFPFPLASTTNKITPPDLILVLSARVPIPTCPADALNLRLCVNA